MPDPAPSPSPVIITDALTRAFGSFIAVDHVSFSVQAGEIFGFLGANGAGKSTTIRILCGLLTPTSGQALVDGIDVQQSPEKVKKHIGYMSQKFSLYPDLLVEENLEFFGGVYGIGPRELQPRIEELLEQLDLARDRRKKTVVLPGGIRQRLALASALLHRPRILFLDEPTAGVDPAARRVFWRIIRQLASRGTTIFVTTHYMDEAEYCHRLGLMVDGRLVALGKPAELKKQFVWGQLYRLEGRDVSRLLAWSKRFEGVRSANRFGTAVHLLIDPQKMTEEQFHTHLQEDHLTELQLSLIEPSLEDVFLAAVER